VWPAPLFLRGLLVRGVAFWAFVRLMVYALTVSVLSQDPGVADPQREAIHLTPQGMLAVALLVYALVLIDARRRNISLFLANMGVSRFAVGALVFGPVLVAELIVGLLA
jgi:hypothetical protein